MIPEEDWTKGQREFVGTTFPTPKGGVLTVVGVSDGRVLKFICECSICSQDTKLWEKGSIKVLRSTLTRGSVPCGCSKKPSWTERQNKVRADRECRLRKYIFHGWEGEYIKNNTYLRIENPDTGNIWTTCTLINFLMGRGDPQYRPEPRNNDIHIQAFKQTGRFQTGTEFWRDRERKTSDGRLSYWNYTCPVCSRDEYVNAGVCSGVFSATMCSLKKGHLSCRCADTYYWTQQQREYQITKICDTEGHIFTGWVSGGYSNCRSKFTWVCDKGHECFTSVEDFVSCGNRCRSCDKINKKLHGGYNGYFHKRYEEKDYLYVLKFKDEYIKVGRTFDVEKRISGTTTCLVNQSGIGIEDIEVCSVYTASHREVYDTEQWIHRELEAKEFTHEDSTWSTETFEVGCEDMIYSLLSSTGLEEVDFT